MGCILGIDSGSRVAGWGVVRELSGGRLEYVASGAFCVAEGCFSDRLRFLYENLVMCFEKYQPTACAVEDIFLTKFVSGTLHLSYARGVCLLVPALYDLQPFEYKPSHIKKVVTGSGSADKALVQKMVGYLLPGAQGETHDVWDALAVAICHAYSRLRVL